MPKLLVTFCVAAVALASNTARAQTFNCSSNGQYQQCRIPGSGNPQDVRLVKQLSREACIQGKTWGVRGNNVWVDRGCRADFALVGPGSRPPYYGHPSYGPPKGPPAYYSGKFSGGRSNCSSTPGVALYCQSGGAFKYANPINVNGACVMNRTWGVSQYGLWISNGCSGQWEIKR